MLSPGQKLASVLVGAGVAFILILGLFLPRPPQSPETTLVSTVMWVAPQAVEAIEKDYWDRGLVPMCRDLPYMTDFAGPAEAVACYLEVEK